MQSLNVYPSIIFPIRISPRPAGAEALLYPMLHPCRLVRVRDGALLRDHVVHNIMLISLWVLYLLRLATVTFT